MMEFKMIKPFVIELISCVIAIVLIVYCLFLSHSIEIIVHNYILSYTTIIISILFVICNFSRIVITGIRALFDFAFQKTNCDEYTFLKEEPYQASIFTEKFDKNHKRSFGMYYLIHVQRDDKIYTFISPSYVNLVNEKVYKIKTGKTSFVFLKVLSSK